MSNPLALFFDTSTLVAAFNKNKSEEQIAQAAIDYAAQYPHAARLTVSPCLVELFYKTRKSMNPKDVKKNLDILNITLFPITDTFESLLFNTYCSVAYKNEFDFADFCLCSSALYFPKVEILTMDNDDLPLAMARAYGNLQSTAEFHIQTFP